MRAVKILLVDDFKEWRVTVRALLEANSGFQIIGEAGDGLDAVEKAEQLHPDLVLLDIGLPRLNGIEAAARIRRLSPGPKIIFLTQDRDIDIRTAALATGAVAYVLKSDAFSGLPAAINAAVSGPRPSQAAVPPSLVFG